MKASIQWTGDKGFACETEYLEGPHLFHMDAPTKFGGKNEAASPMEMLLAAAGSCAGIDVTSILTNSRQLLKDCKIQLTTERAATPPTVFTKVHMHFDLYGENLSVKMVERALQLTFEKHCSVSIMMIRAGTEVTWDYTLHES